MQARHMRWASRVACGVAACAGAAAPVAGAGRALRVGLLAVLAGGALAPAAGAVTMAELYAGAKAEGLVIVLGPSHVQVRKALTEAFAKAYPGVEVQYSGMQGREVGARIASEARSGVYATDVGMGGTTTGLLRLKPAKLIRRFEDMILADQAEPSKWRDGRLEWADKDKTVLVMLSSVAPVAAINTDLVKPGELTTSLDFLNPKWKGKILTHTPTGPGPGNLAWRLFYDLRGADFVRKLGQQDILGLRNFQQLMNFLVSGRYAMIIGPSPVAINVYQRKGVKNVKGIGASEWNEAIAISPAAGAVVLPNKVPHPAATQLFVNWLLTRDGQTALSRSMAYQSRRLDVPTDHVAPYARVIDGHEYVLTYTEDHLTHPNAKKSLALFREIFRKKK